MLIYRMFSGSFLDKLELIFFIKLSWQKKVIFLQMHNLILQRVISKCKNEKTLKNLNRESVCSPFKKTCPCNIPPSSFLNIPREVGGLSISD